MSVCPLCVRESADKPLPLSGLLVISFCMNHDTTDDDDDEDAIIHLNLKQHISGAFSTPLWHTYSEPPGHEDSPGGI